jgi:hypothetical protein
MFFLLLCPRCYDVVSSAMVEQGGFVQELSDGRDMWFWRCRHAAEDGQPKALRWSMDDKSGVIFRLGRREAAHLRDMKARGRTPVDMQQ